MPCLMEVARPRAKPCTCHLSCCLAVLATHTGWASCCLPVQVAENLARLLAIPMALLQAVALNQPDWFCFWIGVAGERPETSE
jgi:hypothetical protein